MNENSFRFGEIDIGVSLKYNYRDIVEEDSIEGAALYIFLQNSFSISFVFFTFLVTLPLNTFSVYHLLSTSSLDFE